MSQDTPIPASYLVLVVLAGIEKLIGHSATFAQAVERAVSHAEKHLATTEFTHHVTDIAVFAITRDGRTVEYRIQPHDLPIPHDEPSADEIDADEPIGYGLTEAGAAALDMLERRAETTAQAAIVKQDNRRARGHFRPLPYMTAFAPGDDLNYGSDRYRTPHVTIPLREYADYYAEDDDMLQLAAMRVGLFQRGDSTYPLIEFERMSGHDGEEKGPFARYEIHLDEAEQLAHSLLLLLDVARGVTDEAAPNA